MCCQQAAGAALPGSRPASQSTGSATRRKPLRQLAFFGGGTGTGREIKQLLKVGFATPYIVFFLYGGNPRASMRSNGKNLRLSFLTTHLHGAGSRDLHSGLDSAALISVLLLSVVGKGLGHPFWPKKVAIRIQGDGG